MSGGISWRSEPTADQYRHHDYADFAQEFLQRNPGYRRDHAETCERIAAHPDSAFAEKEGLAGRWGLSFPHRAGCRSAHQPCAVVATRSARRNRAGYCRYLDSPAPFRL